MQKIVRTKISRNLVVDGGMRVVKATSGGSWQTDGERFLLSSGKWFTPKPHVILTSVRAISARINDNFDGFPSPELKKSASTFIGKPVFVNHANDDFRRTRGMIRDAIYREAGADKYIKLLIEVDALVFPKLAKVISTGELDSVSMGVDCKYSRCTFCHKIARDINEFCDHVKYHKGQLLPRINVQSGKREMVRVAELVYGLSFFEISYVFTPADTTATMEHMWRISNKNNSFPFYVRTKS